MKNKKIFGIVIGVLLIAVVLVFGATQLKLSKMKPSDVEIVSVYQTDAKHFFVRYLIPEDCSPADAYSTSDQISITAKDGSAAELAFSYKRPLIKKSGKTGCSGTVVVEQDFTSLTFGGQEIWTADSQTSVPAYLTDGDVLVSEENFTDSFVEHIYSSGNCTRWDFDGNVLYEGGCDLEFTLASGSGTIQWDQAGIDAEQISNIYIISKNNAEIVNYDTAAFKKGDAVKLETADTCMLYIIAKDSQNVDWAEHVKVEEK